MEADIVILKLHEAEKLACRVLETHGVRSEVASTVAHALVLADADGLPSHGLFRVPSYLVQLRSKKVDGTVSPKKKRISSSAIEVDVQGGFAYPALAIATDWLSLNVSKEGIAIATICNSHHCGVAGFPVEILARHSYIGLMFANTPKALAFTGDSKPTLGTNPIAFSCPRKDAEPLIIDLSLSKVARGRISLAQEQNESIPDDWAIDADGNPTTDPNKALKGALLPLGGAKGASLALMVEILAAALTRSQFGFEASSFFDAEGASPLVGQVLIAIDPKRFNPEFSVRIEQFFAQLTSNSATRLPGKRRFVSRQDAIANGIRYKALLIEELERLAQVS